MGILDFSLFKMINDEHQLDNIDAESLFFEMNRSISSSILSIVDMDNNVMLSTGL